MTYSHDVFISHASEDKEEFVRPVAEELIKRKYEVWYDEFTLQVGDHLLDSIDRGIEESRYGIVVLSCHFFQKKWTLKELDGLAKMERERKDSKVILPIWYKISEKQVSEFSRELSNIVAVKTSIDSIDIKKVVEELAITLGPPLKNSSLTLQGLKLELSQNDIIILSNLLNRSEFVSFHPARRAFCTNVGVDSNSINYLDNTSTDDFATLFINELVNQDNQDALCQICQKLDHKYKYGKYKKILDDIKRKINCN